MHSVLFKEGKGGYYDKSTEIYKDIILKYSRLVKKENLPTSCEFKDYELANWLLDNNQDFKDHYKIDLDRHTNKAARLKGTIRKMQGKIDALIRLGLMKRSGTTKQDKGTGMVFLSEFTPYTYLLLALLESTSDKTADEEVFDIFQSILTEQEAPSINIFYSILFKKFKERGLYSEFVIDLLTETLMTNKKIRHVKDLVFNPDYKTDELEKVKLFTLFRNETLKEMNVDARLPILLFIKDEIEQKIMSRARSLKDYEKVLLRSKESPQTLAVEGYCDGCKTYGCFLVDTLEYLEVSAFAPDEAIKKDCPTCCKNSLLIPNIQ